MTDTALARQLLAALAQSKATTAQLEACLETAQASLTPNTQTLSRAGAMPPTLQSPRDPEDAE